jgi:hypothetical protein
LVAAPRAIWRRRRGWAPHLITGATTVMVTSSLRPLTVKVEVALALLTVMFFLFPI